MSAPSQLNETSAALVPATTPGDQTDDALKNLKKDSLDPQSLPTRNSSLQKTRNRPDSSSEKSKHDTTKNVSQSALTDSPKPTVDIPPTPPPKNDLPKPKSRKPNPSVANRSASLPKKKKGFVESLLDRLLSCCTPSSAHDDDIGTSRTQSRPGKARGRDCA